MSSFLPFLSSNLRGQSAWFCAGLASSFPDIQAPDDDTARVIAGQRPCGGGEGSVPGCKVFHVSADSPYAKTQAAVIAIDDVVLQENSEGLKDQVLVFQYKGQFHAVDHKCPHMSYPLSNATPFDIEDFGIVLSAGLTCPKHGWSFDMFTGLGDRGNYRLKIWDVELREPSGASDAGADKEVWVRRKQRIG